MFGVKCEVLLVDCSFINRVRDRVIDNLAVKKCNNNESNLSLLKSQCNSC